MKPTGLGTYEPPRLPRLRSTTFWVSVDNVGATEQLTKHFKVCEFTCRCGCGRTVVEHWLLLVLERCRELLGTPLVICSGYRCPVHNRNLNGSARSYHTAGMAVDFVPFKQGRKWDDHSVETVRHLAELAGLGCIWYPRQDFVHLDTRGTYYYEVKE